MDYQKVYNQIIVRARNESREKNKDVYYEAHHIIPKCMGGEGSVREWRTHPNIVLLTAREHFIAHWLLSRIHPENFKLAYAFWFMCKQDSTTQQRNITCSSRTYAEAVSNLKQTKEHTEKIRQALKGTKIVINPVTNELKHVAKEELEYWVGLGWENTNRQKGTTKVISKRGKASLAAKRVELQTGKVGLEAQAAKGPYTVEYQTGEKYTAGSYPELSKLTGISIGTIQFRVVNRQGQFLSGWTAYKGV